jgi:hypothetical protein
VSDEDSGEGAGASRNAENGEDVVSGNDEGREDDPFADLDTSFEGIDSPGENTGDQAFGRDGPGDSGSPFDELDADVEGVDIDELFEEMSTETATEGIDTGSVWSAIEGEGTEPEETSGEEHVVPTRTFCAQCEHVADPPAVECTYEGSEIVEFVDRDHVRVSNCPIVEQRRHVSDVE